SSSAHFLSMSRRPPSSSLSPYTTLFRSDHHALAQPARRVRADADHVDAVVGLLRHHHPDLGGADVEPDDQVLLARHLSHPPDGGDRKSTRLNSSHVKISYAVFCLKKKTH